MFVVPNEVELESVKRRVFKSGHIYAMEWEIAIKKTRFVYKSFHDIIHWEILKMQYPFVKQTMICKLYLYMTEWACKSV